jgi:hypothetical protein
MHPELDDDWVTACPQAHDTSYRFGAVPQKEIR